MIDDVYGDIAESGGVDDCRVVALVQNVCLAIGTS